MRLLKFKGLSVAAVAALYVSAFAVGGVGAYAVHNYVQNNKTSSPASDLYSLDGGVLQLSEDGGETFQDFEATTLPMFFTDNDGYLLNELDNVAYEPGAVPSEPTVTFGAGGADFADLTPGAGEGDFAGLTPLVISGSGFGPKEVVNLQVSSLAEDAVGGDIRSEVTGVNPQEYEDADRAKILQVASDGSGNFQVTVYYQTNIFDVFEFDSQGNPDPSSKFDVSFEASVSPPGDGDDENPGGDDDSGGGDTGDDSGNGGHDGGNDGGNDGDESPGGDDGGNDGNENPSGDDGDDTGDDSGNGGHDGGNDGDESPGGDDGDGGSVIVNVTTPDFVKSDGAPDTERDANAWLTLTVKNETGATFEDTKGSLAITLPQGMTCGAITETPTSANWKGNGLFDSMFLADMKVGSADNICVAQVSLNLDAEAEDPKHPSPATIDTKTSLSQKFNNIYIDGSKGEEPGDFYAGAIGVEFTVTGTVDGEPTSASATSCASFAPDGDTANYCDDNADYLCVVPDGPGGGSGTGSGVWNAPRDKNGVVQNWWPSELPDGWSYAERADGSSGDTSYPSSNSPSETADNSAADNGAADTDTVGSDAANSGDSPADQPSSSGSHPQNAGPTGSAHRSGASDYPQPARSDYGELPDFQTATLSSHLPLNSGAKITVADSSACFPEGVSDYQIGGCVNPNTDLNEIVFVIGSKVDVRIPHIKSIVLHEFAHVLQFRWYFDTDIPFDGSKYDSLEARVGEGNTVTQKEYIAECMAFDLGAIGGKPGGYLTQSGCDGSNYRTLGQQILTSMWN